MQPASPATGQTPVILSAAKNPRIAPEAPQSFRAPRLIFWTALLVRVLYITLAHTYRIRLADDHFQFGWEAGRIARALVTGHGYADPFTGHTGPTSWLPPLYPLLLAAVFKLFGVYTNASAWVILTIDSVFSAATAVTIYEIAARCYRDNKLALWSAWLWALYPAALQYAVHWVWDMAPTALLFTVALVLALRLRGIGEAIPATGPRATRLWLLFGLTWGLIALLNSTPLLFLPACGLWILFGAPKTSATFTRAALAVAVFLACLAPWVARNYVVFHKVIPMRGNLGAELHQSVLEEFAGFPWGTTVPIADRSPTYLRYQQLGEVAYVRQEGALAKQHIAAHKLRFAQLALKRLYFYWVSVPHPFDRHPANEIARELNYCFLSLAGLLGLALSVRNRIPGATLFLWAFLLMPLIYYALTVQARFRHPLEPLITILAVYLFGSADRTHTWSFR